MKSQDKTPLGKKRILVVEDEEKIARLLKARLESAGYNVGWVSTGDQALKIARLSEPDLIILDIMLPRMDGFTIARLLKFDQRFQHIPIVVLTGRKAPQDIQQGKYVHADVYITKPFNAAILLSVIKDLLQKAPQKGLKVNKTPGPLWVDGLEVSKPDL